MTAISAKIRLAHQLKFNMWMSLPTFAHEINPRAKCKLQIVSTWGCTKCQQQPNIVIQPVGITQEGALKLTSNCTLVSPVAMCESEPYTVDLLGMPDYCYFEVRSLNWSQTVKIAYFNEDKLVVEHGMIAVATNLDNIVDELTAPEAITSLINTFVIGLAASSALLIVRSAIISYLVVRQGGKQ
jgi:hypothetical protein